VDLSIAFCIFTRGYIKHEELMEKAQAQCIAGQKSRHFCPAKNEDSTSEARFFTKSLGK